MGTIIKSAALFVAVAIFVVLIAQCIFAKGHEEHYTSKAVVTDIQGEVVEFETPDGNIWAMYGFGYRVGEYVKVSFSDNGTADYIYDDVVLDAVESRK